ncbi:MAG TPA: methyltransferase domain-containing protein [Gammaproteobacteria bacterium]|nr:methyltransferase domain-containing protein [Gammaproteobacteria bacterium]
MRLTLLAAFLALTAPFAAQAADSTPAYVTAALNAPTRKADSADDARRQAAAVVTFAGVKPGSKVLELAPGQGYWTRIFSGVVGSQGHVYALWPNEMGKFDAKSIAGWQERVKQPPYTNVSVLQQPAASLSSPTQMDVVFTCQNYHDYHDKFMGPVDMAKFDKQVFDALKPGGVFVVIDHVANAGDVGATEQLHRIDPAVVKQEVEAAGFVFDGSSDALKNPADPHTKKVFDPSIRGKTDQFIFRFRKPVH